MRLDFGLANGVADQMSASDVGSQIKSIYGYSPKYAPLEQMSGKREKDAPLWQMIRFRLAARRYLA